MKSPEISKKKLADTPSAKAIKILRNEVQIPVEAINDRNKTVDAIADARDARMALLAQMQNQPNVPEADLQNLETILSV